MGAWIACRTEPARSLLSLNLSIFQWKLKSVLSNLGYRKPLSLSHASLGLITQRRKTSGQASYSFRKRKNWSWICHKKDSTDYLATLFFCELVVCRHFDFICIFHLLQILYENLMILVPLAALSASLLWEVSRLLRSFSVNWLYPFCCQTWSLQSFALAKFSWKRLGVTRGKGMLVSQILLFFLSKPHNQKVFPKAQLRAGS